MCDEDELWCDDCGCAINADDWPEHVLSALRSAGYAIVKKPAPNSENGDWIDMTLGDERVLVAGDEVKMVAPACYYSASEAREIAAALLAAADAAEADQ